MPVLVNIVLGTFLLVFGLAIFYGSHRSVVWAGWLRERLRVVLGEGLDIHDWVFAGVFVLSGSLCLLSALMWLGRSHYFWVLSY